MLHSILRTLLIISILTFFLPIVSSAREYSNREHYSLESSVEKVKQHTSGRVLSAETSSDDVHQIRVLTDEGRVKRYRIDDQTGQFIPNRQKNDDF